MKINSTLVAEFRILPHDNCVSTGASLGRHDIDHTTPLLDSGSVRSSPTEDMCDSTGIDRKHWYSVHGNFDDINLTTNIDIYFIAKEQLTSRGTFKSILFGSSGGSPVIRKIFKYRDCIPYNIVESNVATYTGDSDIGSMAVKWRFSTYDVITPIDGKL